MESEACLPGDDDSRGTAGVRHEFREACGCCFEHGERTGLDRTAVEEEISLLEFWSDVFDESGECDIGVGVRTLAHLV